MNIAVLFLALAATTPAAPVEPPRGGVQAVALATVEVVAAARGTIEAGAQEPRRQARRTSTGQIIVEFE